LVVAVLALFPSPAEGFYWVIGGYNYTLPLLVGFAGFALGCGYAAIAPGQRKRRRLLLLGALGAAALFPGFSEFSACLSLILAGVLLVAFPRAQRGYRAVLLVAVVGAVAMLAAPGNLGRLNQHPHEWQLVHTTIQAAGATAYTLLNWLAFPAFWVLAWLGLPLFERIAAGAGPGARLTRHPVLWPLLLVAGVAGCYLFSYVTIHQPLPLRARNLLYGYVLLAAVLSLVGGVQLAQRRGWPLPRMSPIGLFGLLGLALLSDGNGRLRNADIGRGYNTVALAYRDWLSGDARRFDAAERSRYALLRTSSTDSVAVPPLPVRPASLLYYDIGPSPGLWGNKALALYFGKKAVWVDWKLPVPPPTP
jgi:MFS family permease